MDHKPLAYFNFNLSIADYDYYQIIKQEILRTCMFIEDNVGDHAFFCTKVPLNDEGKYITCQILNGKAYFGLYDDNTSILMHSAEENDIAVPTFMKAMRQTREQAMHMFNELSHNNKTRISVNILKEWIKYDRSLGIECVNITPLENVAKHATAKYDHQNYHIQDIASKNKISPTSNNSKNTFIQQYISKLRQEGRSDEEISQQLFRIVRSAQLRMNSIKEQEIVKKHLEEER